MSQIHLCLNPQLVWVRYTLIWILNWYWVHNWTNNYKYFIEYPYKNSPCLTLAQLNNSSSKVLLRSAIPTDRTISLSTSCSRQVQYGLIKSKVSSSSSSNSGKANNTVSMNVTFSSFRAAKKSHFYKRSLGCLFVVLHHGGFIQKI